MFGLQTTRQFAICWIHSVTTPLLAFFMSSKSTSFFDNTSGTRVKHSTFTVTQTTNVHNHEALSHDYPPSSPELAKLHNHCAPDAFLNSAERPDPPRCKPKTRQKLLLEAKGFIDGGDSTSSVMWLLGSAGAGKTAIAQTTAEEQMKEGRLLGCHFFFRTSKDGKRSDGRRWAPNLIHQMVRFLPETLPDVERAIRGNNSVFEQLPNGILEELFLRSLLLAVNPDSGKKFRFGIVKALRSFLGLNRPKIDTGRHWLVVVDGLDECNSQDMQVHILKTIAAIIPKLPIPIRFLIASRPETHIRTTINREFKDIYVHRIDLDQDQDIRKDLEEYYHDRFTELRLEHPALNGQEVYASWPSQENVEILIIKSAPQFIFANTVMNYISHPRGHPVKRLQVILGISLAPRNDKPFLELDALYQVILLTVDESDRDLVMHILTLIYLAGKKEFSKLELQGSPRFIEEFLLLEVGDVPRLLDPLVSILALPESSSGIIGMLHASFFDYFRDPERSGDLTLPLDLVHNIIARRQFDKMDYPDFWVLGGLSYNDSYHARLNTAALDSFLDHATQARMSQDLIMKLFALQEYLFELPVPPPSDSQKLEPGVYRARICSILRDALERILGTTNQSTSKFPKSTSRPSFSDKLHFPRGEMVALVRQLLLHDGDGDNDHLSSLIAQLLHNIKEDQSSRSKGDHRRQRVFYKAYMLLIWELVSTQGNLLYRRDFFEVLRCAFSISIGTSRWERECIEEIIKFTEDFDMMRRSKFLSAVTEFIPQGLIEDVKAKWSTISGHEYTNDTSTFDDSEPFTIYVEDFDIDSGQQVLFT
ncbi:hypothetical protein CPB83DRAFT_910051 [Crepidotus variabilis]|uniref:Nephrocystin 3-like N-terminal domain-containing protein n=1 Tax=Crepidotus variabilis TaxID=179855 RepID=A0A9P6E8D7_9AGAR|nr:hypothetical protein CPB83DRAFT_910051 [Crepidotus variabilis]